MKIIMAMKTIDKNFTNNILIHSISGININKCRIKTNEKITNHSRSNVSAVSKGKYGDSKGQETHQTRGQQLGRFPSNIFLENNQNILNQFPETKSGDLNKSNIIAENKKYGARPKQLSGIYKSDSGSASRFFKKI